MSRVYHHRLAISSIQNDGEETFSSRILGISITISLSLFKSLFTLCRKENLKTFLYIIWKLKRTLSRHSFRHFIEIILIQPKFCVCVDRAEKIFSPTSILVAVIKLQNSVKQTLTRREIVWLGDFYYKTHMDFNGWRIWSYILQYWLSFMITMRKVS